MTVREIAKKCVDGFFAYFDLNQRSRRELAKRSNLIPADRIDPNDNKVWFTLDPCVTSFHVDIEYEVVSDHYENGVRYIDEVKLKSANAVQTVK
jgi:hypothetical protein